MNQPNDPFAAAAAMAATVLTINATAKHPGSIDPDTADAYLHALADGRVQSGLAREDGVPLVENLLHILWRMADFSAARPVETTAALVAAFAQSLAAEGA